MNQVMLIVIISIITGVLSGLILEMIKDKDLLTSATSFIKRDKE